MGSPTVCPMCGSPAYVCTEPHTGGSGPLIHCNAASMHNFPVDSTPSSKD